MVASGRDRAGCGFRPPDPCTRTTDEGQPRGHAVVKLDPTRQSAIDIVLEIRVGRAYNLAGAVLEIIAADSSPFTNLTSSLDNLTILQALWVTAHRCFLLQSCENPTSHVCVSENARLNQSD